MSDVERFDLAQPTSSLGCATMEPEPVYGDWVRASDYDALVARLADAEQTARYETDDAQQAIDEMKAQKDRAQTTAAPQVSVMDDTAPTLWGDMTDAQKGALLLAIHEGKVIEVRGDATSGEWKAMTNGVYLLDHCAYRARALTTEGKDNE